MKHTTAQNSSVIVEKNIFFYEFFHTFKKICGSGGISGAVLLTGFYCSVLEMEWGLWYI